MTFEMSKGSYNIVDTTLQMRQFRQIGEVKSEGGIRGVSYQSKLVADCCNHDIDASPPYNVEQD